MSKSDVECDLIVSQLKKFREAYKLSQQAVADILEISNQQYSKYESGRNRIAAFQILKICKHFSIDAEMFFSDCEFSQKNENKTRRLIKSS